MAESIVNKIDKIYQSEEYYLSGTDANKIITNYSVNNDINALITGLETYQISLSEQNVTLYVSTNRVLEAAQIKFVFDKAGNDNLTGITLLGSSTAAGTSLSGALVATNTAVQNAVGKDALTGIALLGVETKAASSLSGESKAINTAVQSAIGNNVLTDISILGVVTKAATSLSTQLANFATAVQTGFTTLQSSITALQNSVGSTKIAPTTPITVMSCTKNKKDYSLEKPIYTTSNDATKTIFNILECVKWADSKTDLYLSRTGEVEDCTSLLVGKAFEACAHYLHPNP